MRVRLLSRMRPSRAAGALRPSAIRTCIPRRSRPWPPSAGGGGVALGGFLLGLLLQHDLRDPGLRQAERAAALGPLAVLHHLGDPLGPLQHAPGAGHPALPLQALVDRHVSTGPLSGSVGPSSGASPCAGQPEESDIITSRGRQASWPATAQRTTDNGPIMKVTLDYGRTGLDVDLPDDRARRPAGHPPRRRRSPTPTRPSQPPWPTPSARRRWPSSPAAARTPASSSATSPGRCRTSSSCRRCCAPSKQQGIAARGHHSS